MSIYIFMAMVKKALCLAGHMRGYKRAAPIIRKFDGDIFIATWDEQEINGQPLDIDDVIKEFQPKDIIVENFSIINNVHKIKYSSIKKHVHYNATWHKGRNGWDSYSMFYLIKKVGELKQEHEFNGRYDLVMRFRPDYVFQGFEPHELAPKTLYFPANANYIGTTDNLMYGRSDVMDLVFMCYDLMDMHLIAGKANWINEQLLYHHINHFGLHIKHPSDNFTYERWQYGLPFLL